VRKPAPSLSEVGAEVDGSPVVVVAEVLLAPPQAVEVRSARAATRPIARTRRDPAGAGDDGIGRGVDHSSARGERAWPTGGRSSREIDLVYNRNHDRIVG
jgi:hypothetical protein